MNKLYKSIGLLAFSLSLGATAKAQTVEFTLDAVNTFPQLSFGTVTFGDIDGDNDQDVLIGGMDNTGTDITNLYTNDGTGVFTLVTGTTFSQLSNVNASFFDVDGDGDVDLLQNGENGAGEIVTELYENDGTGTFTLNTDNTFVGLYGQIVVKDIDGDNDLDFFVTGFDGMQDRAILYMNDGTGIFTENATAFLGLGDSSADIADANGDGHLDIIVSGTDFVEFIDTTMLYLNDGASNFTPSTVEFSPMTQTDVKFGDLNGDGAMDVVLTGYDFNYEQATEVYMNDGTGAFTLSTTDNFVDIGNAAVTIFDVEGDGDMDVFLLGSDIDYAYYSNLYINDGTGTFTLQGNMPFIGVDNAGIALADVNGDGKIDVLYNGQADDPYTGLYINGSCFATHLDQETLPMINSACAVTSLTAPTASACTGTITATTTTTFPITMPGTTIVTWVYNDGFQIMQQQQTVLISAMDLSVAIYGTSTLHANADAATHTFQWINCADNSSIAVATNQTFNPTATGSYAVVITNGNCVDTSDCKTINQLGVAALNTVQLQVYPNPSESGVFNLLNVPANATIEVMSLTGNVIYTATASSNQYAVNLTNEANGVYILQVNGSNHTKIVKK